MRGVGAVATRLRILQYNTHLFGGTVARLVAGFDDARRRDAIVRAIRDLAPDLVLLDELWSRHTRKVVRQRLADILPHSATDGLAAWFPRVSGMLVLSRHPITDITFDRFHHLADADRWSAKGILGGTVALGSQRVRILATHTQAEDNDAAVHARASNFRQIIASLARAAATHEAVVLGGDFNVRSAATTGDLDNAPFLQSLAAVGMVDAYRSLHPDPAIAPGYTYLPGINPLATRFWPGATPSHAARFDYVFVRGLTPVHAEVVSDRFLDPKARSDAEEQVGLSDHEPLYIEVELLADT